MPTLRPFRALRYDPAIVWDLAAVICPPYDVISATDRQRLLARDPRNIVRVELAASDAASRTADEPDPYARAAEILADWRHQGVLRTDPEPALYAYEARYRLGDEVDRFQRGFFARLRLEPFGEGIRPHERTLSAPKEDRLRLMRATRVNTSPIVVLADPGAAPIGEVLSRITEEAPDVEATDDAGVRHRLWMVPAGSSDADSLLAMGSRPLTIADGHHRYETALRYRDETRQESGGEGNGERPEDHVMALILDVRSGDGPVILPTHRIIGDDGAFAGLWELAGQLGGLTRVSFQNAGTAFSPPFPVGPGVIGLLGGDTAWLIDRDRSREGGIFDPASPEVVRSLDVALVEAMLRRAGLRELRYTHEAGEALEAARSTQASAAFLLAPTPIDSVLAVAASGALMPQKSTYFYPKVATGLVIYPLEG